MNSTKVQNPRRNSYAGRTILPMRVKVYARVKSRASLFVLSDFFVLFCFVLFCFLSFLYILQHSIPTYYACILLLLFFCLFLSFRCKKFTL